MVAVLVGLGGLVVFLNNQATDPGTAPQSDIIDSDTGAISFGTGEDEIDTYVDFMCPACNAFESQYGEALQSAAAANAVTLRIHPVAILDRLSQGTEYSSRAASAMYCVASESPDSGLDFFNLLYANQPAENTAGLADDELSGLADQAGAVDAAVCIADGTYMDYVGAMTEEIPAGADGRVSTPTVTVNGDYIENPNSNQDFASLVSELEK